LVNSQSLIDRESFANVRGYLPSALSFDAELEMWQQQLTTNPELASQLNTPEKAIPNADSVFYPNILVLLRIMATLPLTSCECKRLISLLRLIKTSFRSSINQDRLNGLALLHCHQSAYELTPEEVVDEFSCCHPRRMTL